MTLHGRDRPASRPEFAFFLTRAEQLRHESRRFSLSADEIALLNPNTLTCPIFPSRTDAELAMEIYRRVPVWIREARPDHDEINPWGVTFNRMFDVSNDSSLFVTAGTLETNHATRVGNTYRLDEDVYIPLFDPKMAQQYNHRAAHLAASGHQFRKISKERTSSEELADPWFSPTFMYFVPRREVMKARGKWDHEWFIGFKDVTGTTSNAIAVFAVIPFLGVGHKFPLVYSTRSAREQALLMAVLNSWLLEYVLRLKFNGLSLAYFFLKQLPVPAPSCFAETRPEFGGDAVGGWLLSRIIELSYTSWDLRAFARDCGYVVPPFRWDDERRFNLRCEVEAALFRMFLPIDRNGNWLSADSLRPAIQRFSTPRDAVAYIMDSCAGIRNADQERFGEYRSKRVMLEVFDALTNASREGRAYITPLEPGPADQRCCHDAEPPEAVAF